MVNLPDGEARRGEEAHVRTGIARREAPSTSSS
jgi:hypothetical protein